MGLMQRRKGQRVERDLVAELKALGFHAERVPLSGAVKGRFAGDVDLYRDGRDAPFCCEVKARKDGFKELYKWLDHDNADMLFVKADRKDFLVVMPMSTLRELL